MTLLTRNFQIKSVLKFLIVVVLSTSVWGSEKKSDSWSFSLGGITLFDIPKFNTNSISSGTANIQTHVENSMKSFFNYANIDPDIIEDSKLKTVGLTLIDYLLWCNSV